MAPTYIPNTEELRQEEHEFEAAWATQQDYFKY